MSSMDRETKNLLNQAKREILALRRANEVLQAKVDTMELFACVLHTHPSVGMSEDVARAIDRAIERSESTKAGEQT